MEAQELDEKLQDLRKKLDENYVGEVKALDNEALRTKIVQLSKEVEEVNQEKAKDGTLKAARTRVSDLNGGYKDRKKLIEQKRQYVLLTLQERGNL